MGHERTLVLVKPDGVARGLVGEVLSRFERKGLVILGMKMVWVGEEWAENHYDEHRGKPFFGSLVKFLSSSPVVAVCLGGVDAVGVVRSMVGPTNGREAPAGTIRGDLGMSLSNNLVHASDGVDSAAREGGVWFEVRELATRKTPHARNGREWRYNEEER